MSDHVKRKLKAQNGIETQDPAAPMAASKKVRRVKRPEPKVNEATALVPAQSAIDVLPTETPSPVQVPAPPPPEEQPNGFACVKCGIELAANAKECPICGERYTELPKEPPVELERTEMDQASTIDIEGEPAGAGVSVEALDADDGVLEFLEKDPRAFEVALICSECGTALEFATDICPLCGTEMDSPDAGLVGLVSEMTFDEYSCDEIDCPQCGERVKFVKGKCPECKAMVMRSDPHGILRRIDPVIHGDNIVFLHLDVESGELEYLQKAVKKDGFEKMTVRLEGT